MLHELINSVFSLLKKHPDTVRSMASSSMIEYARSTRSEPITMIDHTIIDMPEMSDLMKALTSIYAAMYSQAFSIGINSTIGDIKVMKILERINPNRSKLEAGLSLAAALENRTLTLPDYANLANNISMEDSTIELVSGDNGNDPINLNTKEYLDGGPRANGRGNKGYAETEAITKFHSGLSTGILFNVVVETDGRHVEIPITVRLLANAIKNSNIHSMLTAATKNQTAKERYREWRAGGLGFWKDVILCRDILKENRNNLIKDQTGMMSEIVRRNSNNKIAGLFSGNPSISQISNILILDKETMNNFERDSLKKFKDQKVRDVIFKNTSILVMVVVDRDRDTATFYYHDISVPTIVTFRDLKSSSKGNGLDVMEVVKQFQMGNGIRI